MFQILTAAIIFLQISIYSFSIEDISGKKINLKTFEGKNMLFVNIASGSKMADQLEALQTLQQKYQSTLVIIAFPSNSFGKENKTDKELSQYLKNSKVTNYVIAAKSSVKGNNVHPVYRWLTSQTENEMLQSDVIADFQKYLVNGEGKLIGVFDATVDPLSEELISALEAN